MSKVVFSVVATLCLSVVTGSLSAQVIVPGPHGPVMVSPTRPHHVHHTHRPIVSHPQTPWIVTGNTVTGINPATGGLDTANQQIDHSVFDTGRESSKFNGTRRWVRRPVYNTQGQLVGYQEGWVWNNSFTGREHGDLTSFTPNGMGGVHNHVQHRSHFPSMQGGSSPGGIHRHQHSYSRQ